MRELVQETMYRRGVGSRWQGGRRCQLLDWRLSSRTRGRSGGTASEPEAAAVTEGSGRAVEPFYHSLTACSPRSPLESHFAERLLGSDNVWTAQIPIKINILFSSGNFNTIVVQFSFRNASLRVSKVPRCGHCYSKLSLVGQVHLTSTHKRASVFKHKTHWTFCGRGAPSKLQIPFLRVFFFPSRKIGIFKIFNNSDSQNKQLNSNSLRF